MILAGGTKIDAFTKEYPDALGPLKAWQVEAQKARWTTPQDIKNRYSSVSFRPDNRVIFNIGGNKYRLLVKVSYQLGIVEVRWLGTHAEYNRLTF